MPKIVIATGGRDYADYDVVYKALSESGATIIVEGGAKGADFLARRAADELGIEHLTVWALWETRGKSAGMSRNRIMLRVACRLNDNVEVHAFPGGKGTEGMKTMARTAGVPVIEHA